MQAPTIEAHPEARAEEAGRLLEKGFVSVHANNLTEFVGVLSRYAEYDDRFEFHFSGKAVFVTDTTRAG